MSTGLERSYRGLNSEGGNTLIDTQYESWRVEGAAGEQAWRSLEELNVDLEGWGEETLWTLLQVVFPEGVSTVML